MMKLFCIVVSLFSIMACNGIHTNEPLENDQFKISLDETGVVTELLDKNSGQNLLLPDYSVSFLTIHSNNKTYPVTSWEKSDDVLKFNFDDVDATITTKVESKSNYITLEIIEVNSTATIEKMVLGPYHVLPSQKIGQSIGIAYNDTTAVGLMGLNLKSRGGFEIVPRERFGNAAKKIEGGASLTGFVRDRSYTRVDESWEQKLNEVVPVNDGDAEIKGAKFALYCVPAQELTEVVEEIVLNEDLPYIKTNNVWNKTSNYSTSSKFIMSFDVDNIDSCIDLAKKAGITCVYHGGIFKTWGHFDLHKKAFPNGLKSVRECSDKAAEQNINLGAHVLTNFITPNDSWVTPKPHPGLALAGITELEKDLSVSDTEIILHNKKMRLAYHEPNIDKVNPRWREYTAIKIGEEIIEYTFATAEGDLLLKDCKRGAFGTKVVEHKKGEKVGRLVSHGYKVFFPDINLQDEMAINLAKFFNEGNLKRISFDGIEGGMISGQGRYGSDRFVKVFFDNLTDQNIVANSSDVTHFGWHYFANESWGEPWTSTNFREAHLSHRLNVQKSLKEDLLPRKMGQFSINERTTKKDMEWVMGLCAGYDAGVDFYISPNFEEINKESAAILAEVKKWEDARMNGAFTEEQKEQLRDPYTFYGLEQKGDKVELIFIESWAPEGGKVQGENEKNSLPASVIKNSKTAPVSFDYKHTHKITEPGLPTSSTWEYFCAGPKQKLQYVVRLPKNSKEAVKGIYLKVGTQKMVFPFTLQPGDYLVNKGNATCIHYSEKNKVKETKKLSASALTVLAGKNIIEIDYPREEKNEGPEVIVNFCTKKK